MCVVCGVLGTVVGWLGGLGRNVALPNLIDHRRPVHSSSITHHVPYIYMIYPSPIHPSPPTHLILQLVLGLAWPQLLQVNIRLTAAAATDALTVVRGQRLLGGGGGDGSRHDGMMG